MRKYIKNIKKGSFVKTYDTKNNAISKGKVTELFKTTAPEYYILNEKIKVTGAHPFYIKDEERKFRWKPVYDLQVGDVFMDNKGADVELDSVKFVQEEIEIYNLTVDGHHNYFAGGVLVHNKFGDYYGKDGDPHTSRGDLDSKSNTFNTTSWDSARSALEDMQVELTTHKQAVGAASTLIDADGNISGEAGDMPTGAWGDFYNNIKDSIRQQEQDKSDASKELEDTQRDIRTAKGGELATAGSAYRDQQKVINKAQELSGMVDAGARVKMDANVQATQAQGEAREVASAAAGDARDAEADAIEQADIDQANVVAKAKDAMELANANSLSDTKATMAPLMDSHTDVAIAENKSMQKSWSDARARMSGDEDKNWGGEVTHTLSEYTKEDSIPNVSNYGHNATKVGYSISKDMANETQLGDAYKFINETSGSSISNSGDPEDVKMLSEMWTSADPKGRSFQVVGGTGMPGGSQPGATNNANHFIGQPCFAGDTWIEVI